MRNPRLTTAEKRELMARWASDAHAVENMPAFRQLDDGSLVRVDEILVALQSLDGEDTRIEAPRRTWTAYPRTSGLPSRLRVVRTWDDDDPPPPPVAAAFPVRIKVADALAA